MSDTVAYLHTIVDVIETGSEWVDSDCPFCGKKKHFHASTLTGQCGCYVCGWKGNFITLVSEYEAISRSDAAKRQTSTINIRSLVKKDKDEAGKQEYYKELQRVYESCTWISADSQAKEYLRSRNITDEKINFYRLKEAPREPIEFYNKTMKIANRIFIPMFESNLLVYFQARSYIASPLKVINPKVTIKADIGKSHQVFNLDKQPRHSRIIINEGIFDAMNVGYNAVAIGGKIISEYQVMKILKNDPAEIVVWLDADAWEQTLDTAKIFSTKIPTYVVLQEEGDPGELTQKQVKNLYASRVKYDVFLHKEIKRQLTPSVVSPILKKRQMQDKKLDKLRKLR